MCQYLYGTNTTYAMCYNSWLFAPHGMVHQCNWDHLYGVKCQDSMVSKAKVWWQVSHLLASIAPCFTILCVFHGLYGSTVTTPMVLCGHGDIIGTKFHNFMALDNLISLGSLVMFWTSQLVALIIGNIAWLDVIGNPIEWVLNPSNNYAIV